MPEKVPEPHDFRLTVCMILVPWLSTTASAIFALVFIASLDNPSRDAAALTIALLLALLALFSWFNRLLLRDLLRELPPRGGTRER